MGRESPAKRMERWFQGRFTVEEVVSWVLADRGRAEVDRATRSMNPSYMEIKQAPVDLFEAINLYLVKWERDRRMRND